MRDACQEGGPIFLDHGSYKPQLSTYQRFRLRSKSNEIQWVLQRGVQNKAWIIINEVAHATFFSWITPYLFVS